METAVKAAVKVLGTIDACLFVTIVGILAAVLMAAVGVWMTNRFFPNRKGKNSILPAVFGAMLGLVLGWIFRFAVSWIWSW